MINFERELNDAKAKIEVLTAEVAKVKSEIDVATAMMEVKTDGLLSAIEKSDYSALIVASYSVSLFALGVSITYGIMSWLS